MKTLLLAIIMAIAPMDFYSWTLNRENNPWGAAPGSESLRGYYNEYLSSIGLDPSGNPLAGVDQSQITGWREWTDASGNPAGGTLTGLMFNPSTGQYAIKPTEGASMDWGAVDPATGLVPLGSSGSDISAKAADLRNAAYKGDADSGFNALLPMLGMAASGFAGVSAAAGAAGLGGLDGLTSSLESYSAPTSVAGTSDTLGAGGMFEDIVPIDTGSFSGASQFEGYNPYTPDYMGSDPYGINAASGSVDSGNTFFNNPVTTDVFGNPTNGYTYDLGNSGSGMVPNTTGASSGLNSNFTDLLKSLNSKYVKPDGSINLGAIAGTAGSVLPTALTTAYAMGQNPGQGAMDWQSNALARFNPDAMAGLYDIQTGQGRELLNSNLAARGVSGSSFGNADLTNYNTTRDVGRQALVNQGFTAGNTIANNLAQQQIQAQQIKNQLLGAGLYSAGIAANPNRGVTIG